MNELRFLIVEDHGFQRWTLGHYLEQLGAKTVFNAPDGHTALEMFKSADPPVDIVITDLNMPGMDGIQFIRHVAESGKPVGLVVVTSQESILASVEAMATTYGVNLLGAMKKPVTTDALRAVIARYKGKGTFATEPLPASGFSVEEIIQGLENDEFEPFFQPQLDLSTRALRGAEVLPHWRHRDAGIVGPEAFLPALEASPQVDRLTTIMLRKSMSPFKAWRVAGIEASLSLNVYLPSLTDVTLVDRLLETVREEAVDPRNISFEVSEGAATSDAAGVLENLSRFRMYNFGLVIDGYGIGHSSPKKLGRIPFTALKVDQSSLAGAPRKEIRRAMLQSAMDLAKSMGAKAIADRVENTEDIVVLRDAGYTLVQGPFIAEPMKASEFLRWAMDNKTRAVQLSA